MTVASKITPVILSGGSGTRLWPLSRRALPKQLLPLTGPNSLLQETLERVRESRFSAPLVIASEDHRFLVAEQLRACGFDNARVILEPAGRNTAPAATVAALQVLQDDPDGLVLLMPSDHVIADAQAFASGVSVATEAALAGALVTFGILPAAPETGYGYVKSGKQFSNIRGALEVQSFVEKPDRATAEAYIAAGNYYWNSGMFLFSAQQFLAEVERLMPRTLALCRDSLETAQRDMDFIRLGKAGFIACPSQSIDYAVVEHARTVATVPVEMGWSDVGSWQSLWEISGKDDNRNVLLGDAFAEQTSGSYIRSDGPMVAALGVEDLVIVATKDAVLVTHKQSSQDVKKIIELLESGNRLQHIFHTVVHRPWGAYESIDSGDRFQVKHITVKPGAKLSLQMHHHRAEHWIVVSGTALVTCDDKKFVLREHESTYIPLGAKHQLENQGEQPLHLVEVQSGSYLGEDDIVRFEDIYGRVASNDEKKS